MMALQIPPDCQLCRSCSTQSSSGGGGGGGGFKRQVFEGHGEPNSISFLPDDVTIANTYTDLDVGVIYTWSVPLQAWF